MQEINDIIRNLFQSRWHGHLSGAPIEDMRKQLHKTLTDQANGFWSGHTAYHIAVDGGFLVDSKRIPIAGSNMAEGKELCDREPKMREVESRYRKRAINCLSIPQGYSERLGAIGLNEERKIDFLINTLVEFQRYDGDLESRIRSAEDLFSNGQANLMEEMYLSGAKA